MNLKLYISIILTPSRKLYSSYLELFNTTKENIKKLAALYMACGLNETNLILFIQSEVKAHVELVNGSIPNDLKLRLGWANAEKELVKNTVDNIQHNSTLYSLRPISYYYDYFSSLLLVICGKESIKVFK